MRDRVQTPQYRETDHIMQTRESLLEQQHESQWREAELRRQVRALERREQQLQREQAAVAKQAVVAEQAAAAAVDEGRARAQSRSGGWAV